MGAVAPPQGSSATEESNTSGDDSRRRRWALLLIAMAFLLVFLGTVGVLYDGNLLWLNRLAHPFLFGCFAAGLFGVGTYRLISTHWLRTLVAVLTITVGGGWLLIGFMWVSVMGVSLFPVGTADAPGDHEYKAVVYEQSDFGETVFYVYVRQTRGLVSREWLAGCLFDGSASGDMSFHRVRWETPSRVRVTADWVGNGIDITVDPRTGKPHSTAC